MAETVADDRATAAGQQPKESPVISGPRDLLRRHGVDDSYFDGLTDGGTISDNERDTLLKVMFWMRDFRVLDLERWSRNELNLARLAENPAAERGRLFLLSGRVTRVEPMRPRAEVAARLELEQYFRCELVLEDQQQPAVVFAADVPNRWREGGPINGRSGTFGLFLKFADKDPKRPVPVFVARRMAWYPPTPLGKLGMDAALLDSVVDGIGLGRSRRSDAAEIMRAGREGEAFYAMLDAVGRAQPGQLLREAQRQLEQVDANLKRTDRQGNEQFSVVPLFMEAPQQRGRLVALSGRARRVVRVAVEDADVVARFGIEHYYEISLFTDDSEDNPVIFCVRQLPKGMPTGDGPEYGERVRVAGFFLKLWAYHLASPIEEAETGGSRSRQPAPLLIGREPIWYTDQTPVISPTVGAVAGGLFALALLGIWLALWRSGRSDKRFHDHTLAKTHSVAPGVSLDEIGLAAEGAEELDQLQEVDEAKRPR